MRCQSTNLDVYVLSVYTSWLIYIDPRVSSWEVGSCFYSTILVILQSFWKFKISDQLERTSKRR